jgi:Na+/pantothenate symporter
MALGLGDIVALDFMGRVLSGRTPQVSSRGCYIAALYTLIAGICISMTGIVAKAYYPTLSNPRMVYPIIALQKVPFLLGTLMLIGAMGASMSCANGAILAISSVFARNMIQNTMDQIPDSRLLWLCRFMSFPTIAFASFVAFAIPQPGTLLILAFDIVFAGCFVPLALGVYWSRGSSSGAISSIIVGSTSRLLLYFSIPTNLAGLDTLIPPALSLAAFVAVSCKTHTHRH